MKLKGIDVSHHQGTIDWNKARWEVDYAILSVGYGDNITSQDDKQFHRNAKECTRLGIPFGVYIYSYATSIAQAKSEADHVLRLIKGYKLDYPVYYDLEDANTTGKCSNKLIADMAEVFCSAIEKAGYWAGIYANTSWFTNKLTDSRFNKWVKWVAQYNTTCTYKGKYDMWQYSSSGKVNGIAGNVDMNYCYAHYPNLINPKADVSKPQKPMKPKEEYDMKKIVTYLGDADVFSAIPVSQKYGCPCMKLSDYKVSGYKAKEVIQIGGKDTDTNRFVTMKNAANKYL